MGRAFSAGISTLEFFVRVSRAGSDDAGLAAGVAVEVMSTPGTVVWA